MSARQRKNQRLAGLIKQSWLESCGIHGYRQVTGDLRDLGERWASCRSCWIFLRQVIGWSMQPCIEGELAITAPCSAVWRPQSEHRAIVYSDSKNISVRNFSDYLEAHRIDCSMNRCGNCWNNAAMKSFFSTLKAERLGRRQYRTRDKLRANVFDYIEKSLRSKTPTFDYRPHQPPYNLKSTIHLTMCP